MSFLRKTRKISIGKSKLPPKKRKKVDLDLNSENVTESTAESNFKIISGLRKRNKRIRLIAYGVIAALVIILIVIHLLTPTGLLESIQNGYTKIGKGDFPIDIYSTNCTDFVTKNDVTCLLNDTFFEVYNNRGKLLQAVSHGLSNPELEVSEARFLLFDRDRYFVKIYNYSSELHSKTFDKTIISADISRSGNYAVVTGSDSHFATLYVYNKDNDLIYTWNSADYYITDVALSNNGKRAAVSLINANAGDLKTLVYILDFDDFSPQSTHEFKTAVTSIKCVNKNYMVVSGIDGAYILPWNDTNYKEISVVGVVRNISEPVDGNIAICFGRESNETINSVVLVDKNGNISVPFDFNAKIDDCSVTKSGYALLSENSVFTFSSNGEMLNETNIEIKPNFLGLLNDKSVILCDNSQIRIIN